MGCTEQVVLKKKKKSSALHWIDAAGIWNSLTCKAWQFAPFSSVSAASILPVRDLKKKKERRKGMCAKRATTHRHAQVLQTLSKPLRCDLRLHMAAPPPLDLLSMTELMGRDKNSPWRRGIRLKWRCHPLSSSHSLSLSLSGVYLYSTATGGLTPPTSHPGEK